MRLCLIPAKAASTRLKLKNLKKLGDHSLLGHAILKTKCAGLFDEICVSTESEEVAAESKKYGAKVPFIRPAELSVDPSTLIDVMLHCLRFYSEIGQEITSITLVLPTTPLLSVADIIDAHELYSGQNNASVLSVSEYEHAIFNAWRIKTNSSDSDEFLEPCFPESPFKYTKSTECPKAYRANGGVLITNPSNLVKNRTYRNLPIVPYVMPVRSAVDIDTSFDFELAEFLYSRIKPDWLK